jgi:hypothetical protein
LHVRIAKPSSVKDYGNRVAEKSALGEHIDLFEGDHDFAPYGDQGIIVPLALVRRVALRALYKGISRRLWERALRAKLAHGCSPAGRLPQKHWLAPVGNTVAPQKSSRARL